MKLKSLAVIIILFCLINPGYSSDKDLIVTGHGIAKRGLVDEDKMAKTAKEAALITAEMNAIKVAKGVNIYCHDEECKSASIQKGGFCSTKAKVDYERVTKTYYRCLYKIDKTLFPDMEKAYSFGFKFPLYKKSCTDNEIYNWISALKKEIISRLLESLKQNNLLKEKKTILNHYYVCEKYNSKYVEIKIYYTASDHKILNRKVLLLEP